MKREMGESGGGRQTDIGHFVSKQRVANLDFFPSGVLALE